MAANHEIYLPPVTFPSTKVYFAIDKIENFSYLLGENIETSSKYVTKY